MPPKKDEKKKKIVIPLSPIDILGPFGYYSLDPIAKRHHALDEMMKHHLYKDIISRLNATAIRFKNRNPKITKNCRADMLYLKKKYRPDLLKKSKN